MRTRVRVSLVLAAVVALTVASAIPGVAHTELRSSDPAADATVETLDAVTLEFSSPILDIGSELALVDADGTTHNLEPEYPSDGAVSAQVAVDLPAGATTLQWRIVAEDGHPIEGEIPFTYAPAQDAPAESSPTPSASLSPSAEPSAVALGDEALIATGPSATPSPSESPADDADGAANPWVWVAVSVAVMGTAAAALVAQSRRK